MNTMLIELAGREALPSAIALQTTAFNSGRVLGPITAAWLVTPPRTVSRCALTPPPVPRPLPGARGPGAQSGG